MTIRTMYDAINADSLPTGGDLYAGYVDGKWPSAGPIAARFPGKQVVHITVNPSHNEGSVGDGPPDNGSWPEWVSWVVLRRSAGADPTVYTNESSWAAGKAAFASAGVAEPHWWIAHYDNDPTIPAGAIAKQYASNNLYDTSSVAEYWPGVDPTPPPAPTPTPVPATDNEEDMRLIQSPAGIWLLSGNLYVHVDKSEEVLSFQAAGLPTVQVDTVFHASLVAASSTPSAT